MLANEKQKSLNERFEQVRMLLSQAKEKNTSKEEASQTPNSSLLRRRRTFSTPSSLRLDFEALSPSGSLRFVSFIGLRFALSSY